MSWGSARGFQLFCMATLLLRELFAHVLPAQGLCHQDFTDNAHDLAGEFGRTCMVGLSSVD